VGYKVVVYGIGLGRPNFTAAWNAPYDSEGALPTVDSTVSDSIYVPYSSTPDTLTWPESRPNPFTEAEMSELDKLFGGLWRLPQDSRLQLEFQDASLRSYKDTSNSRGLPREIIEIGERHTQLDQCGGEFEVVDIDSSGISFKYTIKHAPHPELVSLTQDGLPRCWAPGGSANWRRIMYENQQGLFCPSLFPFFPLPS
jgi:hypothetical protein